MGIDIEGEGVRLFPVDIVHFGHHRDYGSGLNKHRQPGFAVERRVDGDSPASFILFVAPVMNPAAWGQVDVPFFCFFGDGGDEDLCTQHKLVVLIVCSGVVLIIEDKGRQYGSAGLVSPDGGGIDIRVQAVAELQEGAE